MSVQSAACVLNEAGASEAFLSQTGKFIVGTSAASPPPSSDSLQFYVKHLSAKRAPSDKLIGSNSCR